MPSGSYGRDVHPSIGPTLSSPEMLSANNDLEARAELDSPGSNGQRLPELFHAQGAVASSRTRLSQESHDDRGRREAPPEWAGRDDEFSNDVPESLLVEANKGATSNPIGLDHLGMQPQMRPAHSAASPPGRSSEIRDATNTFHHAYQDEPPRQPSTTLLSAVASDAVSVRRRERALWRWANTSHLDRFMRDVYDYYEGGGIICILCSNALWILFVTQIRACAKRPLTDIGQGDAICGCTTDVPEPVRRLQEGPLQQVSEPSYCQAVHSPDVRNMELWNLALLLLLHLEICAIFL